MSILGGWGNVKGGTKKDWIVGGILTGLAITGYGVYKLSEYTGADTKPDISSNIFQSVNNAFDTMISFGVSGIGIAGLLALSGSVAKTVQELKLPPMTAIKIVPREGAKIKPESVGKMVHSLRSLYAKHLWNKRKWVKWRITRDREGKIQFKVIVPVEEMRTIQQKLRLAFPDCVVSETSLDLPDYFNPSEGFVTHLKMAESKDQTMGLRNDLSNQMGDILNLMPDESVLEISFSPTSIESIKKSVKKKVETLREEGGRDAEQVVKRVKERVAPTGGVERTAFHVYFDIWSKNSPAAFIGDLSGYTEKDGNKLKGKPYRLMAEKRNPINIHQGLRSLMLWQANKLTDTELTSFLMLPPYGHPIWKHIETAIPRPPVKETDFQGVYGIGYIDSDDPTQDGRAARLKIKTFTNHGLIAGASGGGKGSALGMLAKLDFLKDWVMNPDSSMGMTICDPHGTTLYLYINFLLELERQGYQIPWERVKCVSFGRQGMYEYPVAMNILHMFEGEEIDQVATDVEEIILSAFNSANMSKGVSDLQRALQVILRKKGNRSILDINTLFKATERARRMRAEILSDKTFNNHGVKEWLMEAHRTIEQTGKDLTVSSIDTRLASLTTKQGIQRLLCRKENYFNVAQILEDGNLVLIDFLGAEPETYKLIAGWLSKKYYDESQKRGEGGRPHLLAFDEVQKFNVSKIFTDIICENRKFNMGVLLVTQMVSRLDEELAEAITSNAGFIMSVRQEAGAAGMQKLLGHPFTAEELTKLEKGLEAAIKSDDGVARLKLEYPQFLLNGKPTWKDSDEEKKAMAIAKEKFKELLARDHKTAEEADQEVAEMFGIVTEKKDADNVVPFEKAETEVSAGNQGEQSKVKTGRRVIRRG